MACIVKVTDKRSGLTYAYRSESYWDKEKKAPRSRRTLIGRVNPETGEIEPTDGRRRRAMENERSETAANEESAQQQIASQGNDSQSSISPSLTNVVEELHILQGALNRLTYYVEQICSEHHTENRELNAK